MKKAELKKEIERLKERVTELEGRHAPYSYVIVSPNYNPTPSVEPPWTVTCEAGPLPLWPMTACSTTWTA